MKRNNKSEMKQYAKDNARNNINIHNEKLKPMDVCYTKTEKCVRERRRREQIKYGI